MNEQRINALEKTDTNMAATLEKLDSKIDTILSKLSKIEVLENSYGYHDQAIARAFVRVEALEQSIAGFARFQHNAEGMAKLAWVLWGILGSGMFMLTVKVLFFAAQHGVNP